MLVQIHKDATSGESKILLKFIDGPKQGLEYEFAARQEQILLGRMSNCTLKFEDNSLSRH